jgi:prepilin-type N-terminal cleavage/methylation domain-containing protein
MTRCINKYLCRSSSPGFTLIESLIVVAIIALAALIVIPMVSGFVDNRNLKTAARDIQGDIFELRERAISESRYYRMGIGSDNYVFERCADYSTPCGAYEASYITKSPTVSSMSTTTQNLEFDIMGYIKPMRVSQITIANRRGSIATITVNPTGRTSVSWNLQ